MNYKEYAETATKNGFKIIPKNQWITLNNMLIKDRIFINKMKEVDNQRIDNLLARCKNGRQ